MHVLLIIFLGNGLQAGQANIGIHPDINHYMAVTYMCEYFSKAEDETLEAMNQALKDEINEKKSNFETMNTIATAYATKKE